MIEREKMLNIFKQMGKKTTAFLVVLVALTLLAVGVTLAFVIDGTPSMTNEFQPPEIDVTILNNEVVNEGDINVYARATVVAAYVSETDGKTLAQIPSVTVSLADGWFEGSDGFYYYKNQLAPSGKATPISSVNANETAPTGYRLQVNVVISVVQADPPAAAEDAWSGVNVENGTLVKAD